MNFPLVKIDRTTAQEWLPILINKGIFTRYHELPTMESVLENKRAELGVSSLDPYVERQALAEAGEYRTKRFVFRDYGHYAVGFDIKMYAEFLNEAEAYVEDLLDPGNVDEALKQIHLYKLGHKLAMIILSEAYRQRKYEELTISKADILRYLGYDSISKQIYQDIEEAMFSLRWLNYIVYQFKTKSTMGKKSKTMGNFIYNLQVDSKSYTVWINKEFLGSIAYVINDATSSLPEAEKRRAFRRGYYNYPTSVLPMTRNYSTPAYLLTNFLILDSGNSKLNNGEHKIIAYSARRFIEEAAIRYKRPSERKNELIKALQEVEIIEKIEPSLDELEEIKPAEFEETAMRVYVKSNLLVAKSREK